MLNVRCPPSVIGTIRYLYRSMTQAFFVQPRPGWTLSDMDQVAAQSRPNPSQSTDPHSPGPRPGNLAASALNPDSRIARSLGFVCPLMCRLQPLDQYLQ